MYPNMPPGYPGYMYGAPVRQAVPNAGHPQPGYTAPPSSSPSDMFAQLQRQVPGFQNVPTPAAVAAQRKAEAEAAAAAAAAQPFKGVSRTNLFVQSISRGAVESGLQTDEQAHVPNMSILGTHSEPYGLQSNMPKSILKKTGNHSFSQPRQQVQSNIDQRPPQTTGTNAWQAHLLGYGPDDVDQGQGSSPKQDHRSRSPRDYRNRRRSRSRSRSRSPRRSRYHRNRYSPSRRRSRSRSPEVSRQSRSDKRESPPRRRRSPDSRRERPKHYRDRERGRERDDDDVHNVEKSITSAPAAPSLKDLQLKKEYTKFIKGIDPKKEEKEDCFRKPLPPMFGTRPPGFSDKKTKDETKKTRFGHEYSEMPPPVAYVKDSSRSSSARKSSSSSRSRSDAVSSKSGKSTIMTGPILRKPQSDKPVQMKDDEDGEDDPVEDFTTQLLRGETKLLQPDKDKQVKKPIFKTAFLSSSPQNASSESGKPSVAVFVDKGVKPEAPLDNPREAILGEEVNDFIVSFIRTVCKFKGGIQLVAKKYNLPSNCIGLTPPKMNKEVWSILKKTAQSRDEILQDVQRWFAVGIIPIVKQVDMFGTLIQAAKDVCRLTSDSLTVLGYVCLNMSIKRRLLMRNSLHKKYAVLCRTGNQITQFLFGDNLAKDLWEIKCGTYQAEKPGKVNNDDPFAINYKPTSFSSFQTPGKEVDVNVASMINIACANEGDVSDLKEKYQIPSNCETLVPPKVNPEIWSLLSRSGLDLDNRLQDVQLSVAEAMVPLMKLLELVHEKKYNQWVALGILTDALALLGNAMFQLNKVRMDAMLKALPEECHSFSNWSWPGAHQISGEDLRGELESCDQTDSSRMAGLILGVVQNQNSLNNVS